MEVMKDTSFYTKLIYEHKGPSDFGSRKMMIEEPAWDLGGPEIMDMFYKIWCTAGFMPEGFIRQCEEWIEFHKKDEE